MTSPLDRADACAVPESRLPGGLLATLPPTAAAPPWDCRVRAVVWLQRGRAPLPAGSAYRSRALPFTLGAVVDYLDTPVGPYREVFAGPLLRPRRLREAGWPTVHVPFIAVDSLLSVTGGREHWALPKTTATFAGDVAAGGAAVVGEGWTVTVASRLRGPRLPFASVLRSSQSSMRARLQLRGRGRLAAVTVTADGPSIGGWLGRGTHPGVVADGRMGVGVARPE